MSLYYTNLCYECGQNFTSNRKLNEHIKVSHREPKKCKYCDKKIISSMKRHVDAKHKVAFCNSFNRHMKTVHNEKNSKSEENRLNRSINLNDSFMSLEEEDDYDVDSSDSKLTEFIRNAFFQKEKFDNGCSVCGKMCKDIFSLQRHIGKVHEEKR